MENEGRLDVGPMLEQVQSILAAHVCTNASKESKPLQSTAKSLRKSSKGDAKVSCTSGSAIPLYFVSSCAHQFCLPCAKKIVDRQCPVCGLSFVAKDIKECLSLKRFIEHIKELESMLLGSTASDHPYSTSPQQEELVLQNDEGRRTLEDFIHDSAVVSVQPNDDEINTGEGAPLFPQVETEFIENGTEEANVDNNTTPLLVVPLPKAALTDGNVKCADAAVNENTTCEQNQENAMQPAVAEEVNIDPFSMTQNLDRTPVILPQLAAKQGAEISSESSEELGVPFSSEKVESPSAVVVSRRTRRQSYTSLPTTTNQNVRNSARSSSRNKRQAVSPLPLKPMDQNENASKKRSSSAQPVSASKLSRRDGAQRKRNTKGETLLHLAAKLGSLPEVKTLIDETIVNSQDNAGWTPLHESAISGHLHIVRLLIQNGAFVNACAHQFNETPLHMAATEGHRDVCRVLIENGADVNCVDLHGVTPLQIMNQRGIYDQKFVKKRDAPEVMTIGRAGTDNDTNRQIDNIVLALSPDVDAEAMHMIEEFAGRFHLTIARQCSNQYLKQQSTHLIVKEVGGSMNTPMSVAVCKAILCGSWIVSLDWVLQSLGQGRLLGERAFAARKLINGIDGASIVGDGIQLGREAKLTLKPPLFSGCYFVFLKQKTYAKEFGASRSDVEDLLRFGGGNVLKRMPSEAGIHELLKKKPFYTVSGSHESGASTPNVFVVYSPFEQFETKEVHGLCYITLAFIFDCIARFRVFRPLSLEFQQ